jgi:hypothetical protein
MTDILVSLRNNGFNVQLMGEKISCTRNGLPALDPDILQNLKAQTIHQKDEIVTALQQDMQALKADIGEQEMQTLLDKKSSLSGWIICLPAREGKIARRTGTLSPIGYGKNDTAAMADLWKKESLQTRNTTTH